MPLLPYFRIKVYDESEDSLSSSDESSEDSDSDSDDTPKRAVRKRALTLQKNCRKAKVTPKASIKVSSPMEFAG